VPDGSPGGGSASSPSPGRGPGWRETLLLASVILAAVFALEIASAALPPVREAFGGFPITIAVLVGGTAGILLLAALRRPGR
jgi:hypothetical protein